MGRGCLFWLLVSVVLSVTLTVVINLVLFVQRIVGICDFLRVARGYREGKSLQGLHGALNRCALLCSLTAKVEHMAKFAESPFEALR
jgi:hypothetical protein